MNIEFPKKVIKIDIGIAKEKIRKAKEEEYNEIERVDGKVFLQRGDKFLIIDEKTGEMETKELKPEQLGGTFNKKPTGNSKIDRRNKNLTGRSTENEQGGTFGIGSL